MRTRHDPKADLADAQALLARLLEQRDAGDSLKIAGERLIALARTQLAALPDVLPPPLSATEKKAQTQHAAAIYATLAALRDYLAQHDAHAVPSFLTRPPDMSEAAFFEVVFARLTTLDYALRHVFFSQHAHGDEAALRAIYARWSDCAARIRARQACMPRLRRAAALTHALTALATLTALPE